MSFGLPEDEERLSYGGYLKVRELTSLQQQKSSPPRHDELLFIIIHQAYELWFKQLLHEIDAVVAHLQSDEVLRAERLLRRCTEIQRVLVQQVGVLETMTPLDFLAFRDHLRPASGFQSAQFREIEYSSGLRDTRFLENYPEGSPERTRLEQRLRGASLKDAFYDLLRRRGFSLPPEETDEARDERLDSLVRLYRSAEEHYDLFLVAETLVDFDELFVLWRIRHVQMVERVIGGMPGTGGSSGAAYLRGTVERKFFPELWEMRTRLSGISSYGHPAPTPRAERGK